MISSFLSRLCCPVLIVASVSAASAETRAIDGDSFFLDDREIRLWGVDAPEWDERGGRKAKDKLQDLIATGAPLSCRELYRDRYDREVSKCTLINGDDLGCKLIQSGVASDFPRYSNGYYATCEPAQNRATKQ